MSRTVVKSRNLLPLRLSDQAYEQIRRDIVNCTLQPGSTVSEIQLARRYRLGKAPVRAALVRLHHSGLVRPVARRGYLIAPITLKDVHDMFEFRALLEPKMTRLAAGCINDEGLRRLRNLCRVGNVTGTAFNRANTEFHVAIARAAGNHRVAEALAQLHESMERLFHLRVTSEYRDTAGHKLLIEALQAADGAAAERLAAEHIERSRRMLLEDILSSSNLGAIQLEDEAEAGPSAASRTLSLVGQDLAATTKI